MIQYSPSGMRFSLKCSVVIVAFACLSTVFLWINLPLKSWPTSSVQASSPACLGKGKKILNPILIYNRVPKTGGTAFLQVVYNLSISNRFYANYLLVKSKHRALSSNDVSIIIKNASKSIRKFPVFYHGHFPYVSFDKYGFGGKVQYINIIRNPLERLVSYYYFLRYGDNYRPNVIRSRMGNNVSFDECVAKDLPDCKPSALWLQIPFFCGGEPPCWEVGSSWALQMAKTNLVSKYLLVGVSEQMGDFVRLLEQLMPRVFKGASDIYFDSAGNELRVRLTKTKKSFSAKTFQHFKANDVWRKEQEFYEFARRIFKDTYDHVFSTENGHLKARSPQVEFKKVRGPSDG